MDAPQDEWMNELLDECMKYWTSGWMDELIDEYMDELLDECMAEVLG